MSNAGNRSGSTHIAGSLLLLAAVMGIGFLFSSFKEKKGAVDLPKIFAAYEGVLDDAVKDPADRQRLKQALGIIEELIYKYHPAGINLKIVKEIEERKFLLEKNSPAKEEDETHERR